MTLEDYKLQTNFSYAEIAERAGLSTDATFHAIKHPWRTRLETVLKAAEAIGAPVEIATEIWKEEKRKYQMHKYL